MTGRHAGKKCSPAEAIDHFRGFASLLMVLANYLAGLSSVLWLERKNVILAL